MRVIKKNNQGAGMNNFDFNIRHKVLPADEDRKGILFRATDSEGLVSKFMDSLETVERFKEPGRAFEDAFGVKVNFGIDSRGSKHGFMATSVKATDEQVKGLPGGFKRCRGPFINEFVPVVSNHQPQVGFFDEVIDEDEFEEMFTIGNIIVFDGFMLDGTLFIPEHRNSRKRDPVTHEPLTEVSGELPLIRKSEFFSALSRFLASEGE